MSRENKASHTHLPSTSNRLDWTETDFITGEKNALRFSLYNLHLVESMANIPQPQKIWNQLWQKYLFSSRYKSRFCLKHKNLSVSIEKKLMSGPVQEFVAWNNYGNNLEEWRSSHLCKKNTVWSCYGKIINNNLVWWSGIHNHPLVLFLFSYSNLLMI